jgi:hypothetical protein
LFRRSVRRPDSSSPARGAKITPSCFSRTGFFAASDSVTTRQKWRRRDRGLSSGSNPDRATRRTRSELPLRVLVFCAGECPPESNDLWPATSSRHADPPVYSSTLRSLLRVLEASRTRSRHGVSSARRRGFPVGTRERPEIGSRLSLPAVPSPRGSARPPHCPPRRTGRNSPCSLFTDQVRQKDLKQ